MRYDLLHNLEEDGKYGFCIHPIDFEEEGKYGFVTSGETHEFKEKYQPKIMEIRDDDENIRKFDLSRRRFVDEKSTDPESPVRNDKKGKIGEER